VQPHLVSAVANGTATSVQVPVDPHAAAGAAPPTPQCSHHFSGCAGAVAPAASAPLPRSRTLARRGFAGLAGCRAGRLARWLVGWLEGCLAGWRTGWRVASFLRFLCVWPPAGASACQSRPPPPCCLGIPGPGIACLPLVWGPFPSTTLTEQRRHPPLSTCLAPLPPRQCPRPRPHQARATLPSPCSRPLTLFLSLPRLSSAARHPTCALVPLKPVALRLRAPSKRGRVRTNPPQPPVCYGFPTRAQPAGRRCVCCASCFALPSRTEPA